MLTGVVDYTKVVFDGGVNNVNDYLKKIQQFEQITNQHMTDIWRIKDLAFQPLQVSLDIQEYISGLFDILKPNQAIPITKIVSVFCYLQIESINLKHEIESKYFDPLIYFGENGSLFEDVRPADQRAGEKEIEMSRSLPVFGEFFDTIRKISALTKNILLQMNGLFDSSYSVFKESFKKINYNEIFDNLGSTLTNLYIVDLIIKDNAQFQDYWKQYNMMFAKVKSNPDSYTITSKMFKKLNRFCSKVYANILSGNLYDEYLNGLKETIRLDLGEKLFKNKTFMEKYLEYINSKIVLVKAQLQEPGNIKAQTEYMTLLVNYSVFRKLFTKDEDPKLFQAIWALQANCPILVLYNNLKMSPGDFLGTVCPLTNKKKVKLEPADITVFLQQKCTENERFFAANVNSYYMRLVQWITLMNSDNLKDGDHMLNNT